MQTTIVWALAEAARILRDNGVSDQRRAAQLLLGKVLDKNLTFLIAHDDEFLTDEQLGAFQKLVERRANGEPIQHLIGNQEFYGLNFEVNKNVLIPRPETEFLVEAALEILSKQTNKYFCDVGTGSGAVAVAIAKNLSQANGVALDISPEALKVARRNAEKNAVSSQLQFVESDLFAALKNFKSEVLNGKFQIIASNPPYIPQNDALNLQREVLNFEPHTALFGGADGLDIIRKLLKDAPEFLIENGSLLFEIGFAQSDKVQELIDQNVWRLIEIRRDLQNIPRTVILQLI